MKLGAALLALTVLCGCTGTETPAPQADQIRHDVEPLAKRFPAVGTPISATWMSGTMRAQPDEGRSGTVPGPSVYWIDAIVELSPATAASLRTRYSPVDSGKTPALNAKLQPQLPPGGYLTGDNLDKALSNTDWRSTAYLHRDSNHLVITSVDE